MLIAVTQGRERFDPNQAFAIRGGIKLKIKIIAKLVHQRTGVKKHRTINEDQINLIQEKWIKNCKKRDKCDKANYYWGEKDIKGNARKLCWPKIVKPTIERDNKGDEKVALRSVSSV